MNEKATPKHGPGPNPSLDVAIGKFAGQPGVSKDQVEQLRSALSSDPDLLASMNREAATGALHGFAPQAAGSPGIPSGQYDKTTGIVTLPSSSFVATGAKPSADLYSVLRVQSMVVGLGSASYVDAANTSRPVTADMVSNLQDTLNGSAALSAEVKRAATAPDPNHPQHRILESFHVLPPGSGVGGSYDAGRHAMNLPAPSLAKGGYDPYDLTFVMGHEVQHGFNAQVTAKGTHDFLQGVQSLAASATPLHDYTPLIDTYVQSSRNDEAKAEIAGWNALQGRVQRDVPNMTLADMNLLASSRVRDFVTSPSAGVVVARPNVALNTDLTMPDTKANVAAMGENYFDRPAPAHRAASDTRAAMNLGTTRKSDYTNYYGSWAIKQIAAAEESANVSLPGGKKPEISINMTKAGLYEDVMEESGMSLPSRKSVPYTDSGTTPGTHHRFDHTADGPHQNTYVPVSPSSRVPQRLDDPSHPDNALYHQARGHVAALDKSLGREPDRFTDSIASALTVQARADGLERIDQVALSPDGSKLCAVQVPEGRNDHLFDLRTNVPTSEANTSMEASAAKWPQAMQGFEQHAQQRALEQHAQTQSSQQVASVPAPFVGR